MFDCRQTRESKQARAARRQAFLQPRLEHAGLTVNQWEVRANVSKNTARKYFDGTTKGLRAETRKKLADELRVEPRELPD